MSSEVYERLLGLGSGVVFAGVAVGVVTNIKDPDGVGRVKLKLPWLSGDVETDWARVAVPMAGPQVGVQFQLRVDDEVLVAFEHGDPGSPFVVGSLWNGKDKPPAPDPEGKASVQTIRSRSGHVVRLDDTQGKEKVEIVAKGEKSRIVIDLAAKQVTITGEQDVSVDAVNGKLTLHGKGGVEIRSEAQVKVQAAQGAEIKGGSTLTLKGGVVNIN